MMPMERITILSTYMCAALGLGALAWPRLLF